MLLVLCAEMTHVQFNMHVRTTQALGNMRVPRVEFRDIRLTRECMWFQHVLFCSVCVSGSKNKYPTDKKENVYASTAVWPTLPW